MGRTTKYTKEDILRIAHSCKTFKEFREKYRSVYQIAWEYGYLEECKEGLEGIRHHWTLAECQAIALKYKTKKEFRLGDTNCYKNAVAHGWIADICKHMVRDRGGYVYDEKTKKWRRIKKD